MLTQNDLHVLKYNTLHSVQLTVGEGNLKGKWVV